MTTPPPTPPAPPPYPVTPAPGWVGGFAQSNPAFAYPTCDFSSLPMLDNMANIDKLARQQSVEWPEFSWQSVLGDETSRCYQRFATNISRIGYTPEGRVYSIICPQQGFASPSFGALNVEVTVTGQRGWVDETAKTMAADMTVEGKIWFTPGTSDWPIFDLLNAIMVAADLPFPNCKDNAIRVKTNQEGNTEKPIFRLEKGVCPAFANPDFALHADEAWDVSFIEVGIGNIFLTGCAEVDAFNAMFMEVFNLQSGNMLAYGNTLSWNVWFTAPQLVDSCEWYNHAEKWRRSIDTKNVSPDGDSSIVRYFDGTQRTTSSATVLQELGILVTYLEGHLKTVCADLIAEVEKLIHDLEGRIVAAHGPIAPEHQGLWDDIKSRLASLFGAR